MKCWNKCVFDYNHPIHLRHEAAMNCCSYYHNDSHDLYNLYDYEYKYKIYLHDKQPTCIYNSHDNDGKFIIN